MTLGEMMTVCRAFDRKDGIDLKMEAALLWRTAGLIGTSVASYFERKVHYPGMEKAFGAVFTRDEDESDKPRWLVIQERMNAKAAVINRRRGGGENV